MTVSNSVQVTEVLDIVQGETVYTTNIDLTQSEQGEVNLSWLSIDIVTPIGYRLNLEQGTDYTAFLSTNSVTVSFIKDLTGYDFIIFYRQIPVDQNINFSIPTDYVTFQNNITFAVDKLTSEIQDANGQIVLIKNQNNNIISQFQAALDEKADLIYVNEQIALLVPFALLGVPNGVATLNSTGQVPVNQLPSGIFFPSLGLWNATTNLTNTGISLYFGVGTEGDKWDVVVGGVTTITGSPTTVNPGDQMFFDHGNWYVFPSGAGSVLSVNAKNGVVVLGTGDLEETINPDTSEINLFYTSARAQADALIVFGDQTAGIELQLLNKVDKDVIVNFGNFGSANNIPVLTTNSQGLVTDITEIPVSILSSNISDFTNAVNSLTIGKANKTIPANNRDIALLSLPDGDLFDSGIVITTDDTLADLTDSTVPTGTAVKGYVDYNNTFNEKLSNKGEAGGYAPLGLDGKVPMEYLSNQTYLGKWDASTNTPFIQAGTGVNGQYYQTSVAGTQTDPSGTATHYPVNSTLTYNDTLAIWEYGYPPVAGVLTVNGYTENVELVSGDIPEGLSPVTLENNLYWTQVRFDTAFSLKTTADLVANPSYPYYNDLLVSNYITSPTAQATTTQLGTVQLAPGSVSSNVPDIDLVGSLLSDSIIDCGIF